MEFRHVIHSLWRENKSPRDIYHYMQKNYGDASPSSSMVYYWVNQFDNGRENPGLGGRKSVKKLMKSKK